MPRLARPSVRAPKPESLADAQNMRRQTEIEIERARARDGPYVYLGICIYTYMQMCL